MSSSTHGVGDWGETQAARYLEAKGFKIIKRNFRYGRQGEIDIIAEDNNTLVFVEVKTQRSEAMGEAFTWVTPRKQRQLGRIAEAYLAINNVVDRECRFDVVSVARIGGKIEITHLTNAFWL